MAPPNSPPHQGIEAWEGQALCPPRQPAVSSCVACTCARVPAASGVPTGTQPGYGSCHPCISLGRGFCRCSASRLVAGNLGLCPRGLGTGLQPSALMWLPSPACCPSGRLCPPHTPRTRQRSGPRLLWALPLGFSMPEMEGLWEGQEESLGPLGFPVPSRACRTLRLALLGVRYGKSGEAGLPLA